MGSGRLRPLHVSSMQAAMCIDEYLNEFKAPCPLAVSSRVQAYAGSPLVVLNSVLANATQEPCFVALHRMADISLKLFSQALRTEWHCSGLDLAVGFMAGRCPQELCVVHAGAEGPATCATLKWHCVRDLLKARFLAGRQIFLHAGFEGAVEGATLSCGVVWRCVGAPKAYILVGRQILLLVPAAGMNGINPQEKKWRDESLQRKRER